MAALETIMGFVSRTNDTGFQLNGSKWYSVSKFADPVPALPNVKEYVRVGVDAKGFARTIEPSTPPPAVDPLDEYPEPPPPSSRPSAPGAAPSRETTITRLACLKVAATFAASRPDMKSTDLVTLAERLEAWTLR